MDFRSLFMANLIVFLFILYQMPEYCLSKVILEGFFLIQKYYSNLFESFKNNNQQNWVEETESFNYFDLER